MRHGERDRLGRAFRQRLKFAIGAGDEFFNDRRRQYPLALADLGDGVAELAFRQPRLRGNCDCAASNCEPA